MRTIVIISYVYLVLDISIIHYNAISFFGIEYVRLVWVVFNVANIAFTLPAGKRTARIRIKQSHFILLMSSHHCGTGIGKNVNRIQRRLSCFRAQLRMKKKKII